MDFQAALKMALNAFNYSTGIEPSPANLRAAARLARHRAQWENTPDTSVMTRQRARAAHRARSKQLRQAIAADLRSRPYATRIAGQRSI